MAKRASAIDVVNALNNQTNKVFNTNLPSVDVKTFSNQADALTTAPAEVMNYWQNSLINMIAMQYVKNKRAYEGYFRNLYKADTVSENIQLIMADLLEVKTYNPDANADDYFADEKADIMTQYVSSMVKTVIPLSSNDDVLTAAFVTTGAFDEYLSNLIVRLYDTMENFDVQSVKEMLNQNISDGNFYIIPMEKPVDKETALAWTASIKEVSEDMRIEMDNKYNLSHRMTWTPTDDGVILGTTSTVAKTETYSLAFAFNESYIDLKKKGQFITLPSTGLCDGKVFGGYFDRDMLEIRNKTGFPKVTAKFFENTLTTKRWLHNWKMMAVSYFNNAVFYAVPDSVGITSAELTTRNGSKAVNRGAKTEIYVKSIVAPDGKIGDKFGTFSISGNVSDNTYIDVHSGKLVVAKDETGALITVTWKSHLDETVTATIDITVNQ